MTGTTRLQFLRPRPAGATIAIEGVLTGSPNIDKADLSLLFAST